MKMGNRIGWILLVGAFVAAAAENSAKGLSGTGGFFGILSAETVLSVVASEFYLAAKYNISSLIHPFIWDPLITTLLKVPGWMILGVPGAFLVWKFRNIPIGGEATDDDLPYTTYDEIIAYSEQKNLENIDQDSKYKELNEYDPVFPPDYAGNTDQEFE